jgi:hypothetical protein
MTFKPSTVTCMIALSLDLASGSRISSLDFSLSPQIWEHTDSLPSIQASRLALLWGKNLYDANRHLFV